MQMTSSVKGKPPRYQDRSGDFSMREHSATMSDDDLPVLRDVDAKPRALILAYLSYKVAMTAAVLSGTVSTEDFKIDCQAARVATRNQLRDSAQHALLDLM